MAGTDYDVIIGSYKAKIARRQEGGYRRRFIRREIQQQLLSQADTPVIQARADRAAMYQTSWAGGATWWKPLLGQQNINTYFQSSHMDVWSEPGKVVPMNKQTDGANTGPHDNCVIATDGTSWYAIADEATTDAAERSVLKWTPASNAWVRETGYSSGIQDDSDPLDMAYDSSDGYFYVLAQRADGSWELGRFNPATSAHDLTWLGGGSTPLYGSAVMATRNGLFIQIGRGDVAEINKATPATVGRFNPGNTELLSIPAGTEVVNTAPLMIDTPQGMYLIRNHIQQGQPIPFVYRIDKDAAGNFIGNPIATLPLGSVALSMQFHLGQLLISTTPDYANLLDGEENLEIVVYFVGEGGKGALGSMLGGRDELDETPYRLLGTSGSSVYIAGSKRLWLYDAIRGGLHTVWEWTTAVTDGGYMSMARAQDSDGHEVLIFLGKDRMSYAKIGKVDNPDTVTTFGDDENHYILESNYFDFGMPMETKELTKVEIQRAKDDGGSEWTVQIEADDGSFSDILTDSGNASYASADLSGTTGRRFRYKLIYQTKDTARKALESLKITANTGENVQEWHLLLDGDEILNVNNELQNEQDFYDDMVALGETEATVLLIDNMQGQEQEIQDDATGIRVKVTGIDIIKEKPGESLVQVVLTED